jgi:hypothetical protein
MSPGEVVTFVIRGDLRPVLTWPKLLVGWDSFGARAVRGTTLVAGADYAHPL